MANEATKTDQYVRREIELFGIPYDEQGSSIKEIQKALKGASKQSESGQGKPEFIFTSDDILIIVEDKLEHGKLIRKNEDGELDLTIGVGGAVPEYAVNGAVHYARHIVEKTDSFKEIIAVGVVGDSESHIIQPYYVSLDEEELNIKALSLIKDFQELHPKNISEWYNVNILGEITKEQKQVLELQKVASELHEDLRNYGSLEGENKATVVSAVLLALAEKSFKLDDLIADDVVGAKDGDKIINAVRLLINREGVMPESKVEILLNKFAFVRTNIALNTKNKSLAMTPLKYFANKLNNRVLHHFKTGTEFDILGNFYGEFVKYGGSDGNSLGIVLTPRHITSLMAELIEIRPTDVVLDPACGSGAFLISAMNRMIEMAEKQNMSKEEKEQLTRNIKQHQLLGIEMQEKMFTVATTNMILRGDGKSNLHLADMFKIQGKTKDEIKQLKREAEDSNEEKAAKARKQLALSISKVDKILFNPPYSQGKTDKTLTEISFIHHALEMEVTGGKMAAIVPQSTMVGKSKEEKQYKKKILEKNTLEFVITLNKDTFHGVGVNPCIAVFTAGEPHPANKQVQFVNFENDGFVIRKHIGLMDDGTGNEKRQYLLDVLRGNIFDFSTKFIVRSTITAEDEWLHSFFYFNDELPTEADFEKTIADYLTFRFDMYAHGRGYLFENEEGEELEQGK